MQNYNIEFLENKKSVGKICRENNVTELEVLKVLDGNKDVRLLGKEFVKKLLADLHSLGELLMLIEREGSVFEITSPFPCGEEGHGYYNFHRAPFSGHFNIDKITNVAVVAETLFGKRSCSWRFIGEDGSSVLKVYIKRDANKEFLKPHLESFEKWLAY
ncbi:MAG: hypothetical protein LBQ47_02395 [Endomicrobium sp.]|jgi:putative heme utilization carrier protein HutX|nr:hypothetical protein [Endomicrobium sp.]